MRQAKILVEAGEAEVTLTALGPGDMERTVTFAPLEHGYVLLETGTVVAVVVGGDDE